MTFTLERPLAEGDTLDQHRAAWERDFLEAWRAREERARREVERLYHHDRLERDEASLADESFEWDLFAQESRRVFGLDQWQLIRIGAVGGATIGGTIDAATLGHSFMLGTLIGGLVGGVASWIGTERAIEMKVLGQSVGGRVATIGPLDDPQFPWILLDRALLHFASVVGRAHAKRDPLKVESSRGKQSVSSGLDGTTRGRIGALLARVGRDGLPAQVETVDEIAATIVPLMERIGSDAA